LKLCFEISGSTKCGLNSETVLVAKHIYSEISGLVPLIDSCNSGLVFIWSGLISGT